MHLGRTSAAVQACRKALEHNPQFADAYSNLGLALRQRGDVPGAVEAYRRAIEIDPDFAEAHNNLGVAYMDLGDTQLALDTYEKALELDPDLGEGLLNFSRARRFNNDDGAQIESMEALLDRGHLSDDASSNLHFALGKIHDDCGSYARAFDHFQAANRYMRKHVRFDATRFRDWVSRVQRVFDPDFFRRWHGLGDACERPVFIVGMSRSGTTLVEQILASHPLVHGGDELTRIPEIVQDLEAKLGKPPDYPDCIAEIDAPALERAARDYVEYIDSLDNEAPRITDKLPGNFFHLGLISVMLPRARVIHCRRDPMDVCLSNYMQKFAEGHYFSYDLSDIAAYYQEYERIMAYWREVLPMDVYEVQYEDLVDDQESISRELVAYCGLDWDARCLRFHETRRSVRTASNWQVRQPLYTGAKRRWKNYEPFLGELISALGDSIDARRPEP
jgi:tetratricopeptide (TPR) repeat protein